MFLFFLIPQGILSNITEYAYLDFAKSEKIVGTFY